MSSQTSARKFIVPCAERVAKLPPYVFATIFAMKEQALAAGREVIDLGVGNPDGRPATEVVEALNGAMGDASWNCHGYSTFRGLPRLREAIAAWYFERFAVRLDAETETLPLIGSKEGLANLMRAYLNAGDTVVVPTPCYPAYFGAARLCEAEIFEAPLREEHGFVLQWEDIPDEVAARARMLILNYPHNPTGGTCDLAFFEKAVAWAKAHEVMLVSDIAYSELGFDPDAPPPSLLQVDGARDVAVEMQSLSKSHNLAGWRIGFAAGAAEAVGNLGRVKSNVDFSVFGAIQMAAVAALEGDQQVCATNRELYRRRRDRLADGFRDLGWEVPAPTATMYLWARVPAAWRGDDMAFVRDVFDATGVLLSPGSGFGKHGRGYARVSLVIDEERCDRVLELMRAADLAWR